MPRSITFEIPGKPMAKQRHRSTRKGNMYTPENTVNYQDYIRWTYTNLKKRLWFKGYVWIKIDAFFKIPKSSSKKNAQLMLDGVMQHDKKPDGDNIEKIIMDGLTGAAYADDKQVTKSLGWSKNYTLDYERVVVTLTSPNNIDVEDIIEK